MNITIMTVGSKPKSEINSIIQSYFDRLPRHINVTIRYIKHSIGDTASSIQNESESILKALPKKNKIILLDESGQQFSSPQLSRKIFSESTDITFVIGGAYGVNEEIVAKANTVWSLGKLVFPHQIVRIILAEQIYRAHTINIGHPYHHQ